MESITLQVGDSIVTSGDSVGQVQFAASAESDGGASRYVIGQIYAQAEGAFGASSNPASIVISTSAADNLPASGKLKVSHEGHVLPMEDNLYDLGSSAYRFRNLYVANDVTIAGTGNFDYLIFNTGIGDVDMVAGQTNWNNEAGTLEIGLTDDLKIQVGQTVLFRVKNSTGSSLSKGQAVYASGVLGGGQIIQAAKFAADESVDEIRFIGLMTDDLANGDDGFVNHFGHIKNVDLRTSNTAVNPNGETWAIGDILYVDDGTAGGLTKNAPQDDIYVAMVLEDGQNGELFVRITDPGHMTDLHDVNLSGLVDNNLMVWNSGADYWEPTTSMTFDGTTLHCDTDGITAKFGRDNAQTNGGKVRIYVDDADTAGSVQAIKAFNAKTTGYNYGINATANGSGATRNVGLYGWAAQATTNWGLWVDAGDAIFDENVGIGTSAPAYDLHVNGSGYVVNDFNIGGSSNIGGDVIVGGNVTIQGTTVTANVSSMEIEDPIFTLGQASGTIVTDTNLDRGLALVLSTGTTAFMGWDTSEGEFSLLSNGVATNDSGNYAPGTYGNLHIAGLTASTANFSSTIDAANLGAGEDNSVVILDSDGKLRTDEIDSRVWGSSLVDGSGVASRLALWDGTNSISSDSRMYYSGNDIYFNSLHGVFGYSVGVRGNRGTNVGLESNGSNGYLALAAGGSEKVRIATNGDVGIGTTSPSAQLHIVNADDAVARIESNGTDSTDDARLELKTGNGTFTIQNDRSLGASGVLTFAGNVSDCIAIDHNNGYVGVGTVTPDAKLEINSIAEASGDARYELLITEDRTASAGRGGGLAFSRQGIIYGGIKTLQNTSNDDNTSMYFQTRGAGVVSNRMTIDEEGNVGIGDATPSAKLHVVGSVQNGSTQDYGIAAFENSNLEGISIGYDADDNYTYLYSREVGVSSRGLRLNGSIYIGGYGQNVGIGTTSPSTQLDVFGSGNFTGDVSISGHLSAATKSFLINHPTREGHKLQYGSLESPYHGVRLTGRARVDNGWCVVKLPEYISELVHNNNDINIQITNIKHGKVLYVDDTNIAHNEFTVKTDSWFNKSGLEFYWTFTAVRKDVKELQVEF